MSDPDLTERLAAIGRTEPTPLTDDRLSSIESRVAIAVRSAEPIGERGSRAVPFVLTAAAVVLLIVLVSVAFGRSADQATFDVAEGVVLELPEARGAAAAGDELPEGALVDITAGGVAVVDGMRYGPGRYRVSEGRLVPLSVSSTSSTTPVSVTPTRGGTPGPATSPPTTDAPEGSASTTAPAPSTSTTDVARARTTTVADRPATTVANRTTTTVADRPTTTTMTDRTTTTTVVVRPTTTVTDRTTTTVADRPTTTTVVDRPTTTLAERDGPSRP